LADLQLTEVATPPDGHCFFTSCYCIKTGVCPDRIASSRHLVTTHNESSHYRQGCYETLLAHYETHVHTGLVDEADLRTRFQRPAETADELRAQVQAHFESARALDTAKRAPIANWAGETEIKATVYWFREPMLVYDKCDKGTIFAWLYHMSLTAARTAGSPRRQCL
jgi:hypothetical protein